MLIATRLIRVMTYHKELSPIYLRDPMMWWSFEILWQIKYNISLPIKDPWTPNKVRSWYKWEVSIHKAIWSFDHVTNVKSRDNLKNLYFHHYKTYDQ